MKYNREFWDTYADGNEARYNDEFAKFVRDLTTSLGCTSVLEVGCGTGIDLRLFPNMVDVFGIDLNEKALDMARQLYPHGDFRNGDIASIPFGDSSVDFVFTHGLLNYLEDDILDSGFNEMYRVANKYIMNCELFGESEEYIDNNARYRNVYRRWLNYTVKIISNVDMHKDIDSNKPRFTLLRKIK